MKLLFVAIAGVGCSSPAPPVDAYPSGFMFTALYMFDSTITSFTNGSLVSAGSATLDFEEVYNSYAEAQGDSHIIEVTAYGSSSTFTIGPNCGDLQLCLGAGTPYSESAGATVTWLSGSDAPIVYGQYTCDTTTGAACSGTIN